MGELVFVGLGLFDEQDLSIRGLEEIKTANSVFLELYTSLMPGLSISRLEAVAEKEVTLISRHVLEEEDGQLILKAAKEGKVVFLVPGDPLIATTHVDLRIKAETCSIETRVVHGASIISAVIGLSGLQNYKYGRSVTIPFPQKDFTSTTPNRVIRENQARGLHTLCYLDIQAEEQRFMTIREGLEFLLDTEKKEKKRTITMKSLALGVARAGSDKPIIKAGYVRDLMDYAFGTPPHTLVFPGKLHFMEAEALITLAGAPEEIRELPK